MRAAIFVLALAAPAAAGPLVAGAQHEPPRFIDESHTLLNLHRAHGADHGYAFYLKTFVAGRTSTAEAIRLDWKSGGKVIGSAPCTGTGEPAPKGTIEMACTYDGAKGLHARGPIEAQLIYTDDQDGKDYLLRDFKVTVAQWTSYGDEVWQIVGDDLLGAAYATHLAHKLQAESRGKVSFELWATVPDKGHAWELRCTVDGNALPDVPASQLNGVGSLVADQVTKGTGAHTLYSWTQLVVVADLRWGPKQTEDAKGTWLADHPGDWVCGVRTDTKTVRELHFHVTDQGMVESDPMAAGGPPLVEGTALVDVRIPKDATFDQRLRPAAMKLSRGYGLPWPDHPNVKAILAALPAARGLPDPH